MLRSRKVIPGKYYVNNARQIVREVLIVTHKTVLFNTYHQDTGNSCNSPSVCTLLDFIHWADHEATPAEIAGLQERIADALLHDLPIPEQEEFEPLVVELT